MMNAAACPDDLLARSRRDLLAEGEREALQAHLSGCQACRMLATLGEDFDRVLTSRPRDELLVARIAHRAAQASVGNAPGLSNGQVISLVAAVAAAGMGAGAWLGARWTSSPADSPPAIVSPAGAGFTPTRAPTPPAVEPMPSPAPAAPQPQLLARPVRTRGHAEGGAPSAGALFAEANETRRDGSYDDAIALYRQLQRLYPRSPEAKLSHLSLANLLLAENDRAERALPQFEAYLASGGALEEEALYGRAQALQKLARPRAEQAAWRTLLSRFPDSVYAPQARRRLDTLP